MFLQVPSLSAGVVALCASVRFFSWMDQHVYYYHVYSSEKISSNVQYLNAYRTNLEVQYSFREIEVASTPRTLLIFFLAATFIHLIECYREAYMCLYSPSSFPCKPHRPIPSRQNAAGNIISNTIWHRRRDWNKRRKKVAPDWKIGPLYPTVDCPRQRFVQLVETGALCCATWDL